MINDKTRMLQLKKLSDDFQFSAVVAVAFFCDVIVISAYHFQKNNNNNDNNNNRNYDKN